MRQTTSIGIQHFSNSAIVAQSAARMLLNPEIRRSNLTPKKYLLLTRIISNFAISNILKTMGEHFIKVLKESFFSFSISISTSFLFQPKKKTSFADFVLVYFSNRFIFVESSKVLEEKSGKQKKMWVPPPFCSS